MSEKELFNFSWKLEESIDSNPTIDLNDADGILEAYEIRDWQGLAGQPRQTQRLP